MLVEGETCWRLAKADRLAVIVDAAGYFAAAKAAILKARHTVFLIGWDFDLRIRLEPGHDSDVPDELGTFLTHVVRHRPDLRIFVLRWDLSFLKFPFRGALPLKVIDWLVGKRIDFHLDHEHPSGACHHQKIVVIDDALAFCGGIDMTLYRWDTPAHPDEDPRRVTPAGHQYPPWHDATTCLEGEAARVLGDLARERWRRAVGEVIPPSPPDRSRRPLWPETVQPDFTGVEVALARTEPLYGESQPEIREIEKLYLAAIRSARRTLYIETQYLASFRLVSALIERLKEEDGPEIVVINPKSATGWLEEEVMGAARAVLLGDLRKADRHDRFRIFTPVTEGGQDIYVHAKVVVVDDMFLRVGSSNVNNRSMGLDTECDLALEVHSGQPDPAGLRRKIEDIRNRLVSEHLGVAQAVFEAVLREEAGSLIRAIERLQRPEGRSLAPFEPPELTETEAAVARKGLLDPDRPEALSKVLRRGMAIGGIRRALSVGLAGTTALALAALAGSVLWRAGARRWRRRRPPAWSGSRDATSCRSAGRRTRDQVRSG
jgi:phospholipase D1/2